MNPPSAPFDAPEAKTVRTSRETPSRAWPASVLGCSGCLLWLAGMAALLLVMFGSFGQTRALRCCEDEGDFVVLRAATPVIPILGREDQDVRVRVRAMGAAEALAVSARSHKREEPLAIAPAGGRIFAVFPGGARPLDGGDFVECGSDVVQTATAHEGSVLALIERPGDGYLLARFDGDRWTDAEPVMIPGSGMAGGGEPNEGEEEEETDPSGGGPVPVRIPALSTGARHWVLLVHQGEPWLFWQTLGTVSWSRRRATVWERAQVFGVAEKMAAASDGERVVVVYDRQTPRRMLGFEGLGVHVWDGAAWGFSGWLPVAEGAHLELAAGTWRGTVRVVYGTASRVDVAEIAGGALRPGLEVAAMSRGRELVRWLVAAGGLIVLLAVPVVWGCSAWADRRRPREVEGGFGRARAASIFRRFLAHAVDAAASGGPVLALFFLRVPTTDGLVPPLGMNEILNALGVAGLAYGAWMIVFEATWGTTPGKALFGLRVIRDDGARPGWPAAVARNLFRVVDLVPGHYQLGAVMAAVTDRSQRLGDLIAHTLVVEVGSWRAGSGNSSSS